MVMVCGRNLVHLAEIIKVIIVNKEIVVNVIVMPQFHNLRIWE